MTIELSKVADGTFVFYHSKVAIVVRHGNPCTNSDYVLLAFVANPGFAWNKSEFANDPTYKYYIKFIEPSSCEWGYWCPGSDSVETAKTTYLKAIPTGSHILYSGSSALVVRRMGDDDILLGFAKNVMVPPDAWSIRERNYDKYFKDEDHCTYGYWGRGNETCEIIGHKSFMSQPSAASKVANKHNAAIVDVSDWRVWAKQPSENCPCGMLRKQCDYHRG